MKIKIDTGKLLQYFLILLFFVWQNAGIILSFGTVKFYYIVIAVSALVILTRLKGKIQKKAAAFAVAIVINIVFVRFISGGGAGITTIIRWLSAILLTYVAIKINKGKFMSRYIKVVAFFAVISIVMWGLTLISPDFFKMISIFKYVPYQDKIWSDAITYRWSPVTYYGNFFYVARFGNDLARNNGIFNEPGLHQIVLNTALFYLLNYGDSFDLKKKQCGIIEIVLIAAIITCQSTTGYIGLLINIVNVLITGQYRKKVKIIGVIFLTTIMIIMDYGANGSQSFIGTAIISKLFAGNSGLQLNASGTARMGTIAIALSSIISHPLGVGFAQLHVAIEEAGKRSVDGAAIFSNLMALGISFWIITIYFIIVPMYRSHKTRLVSLCAILLYINTVCAQSDVFYPALLVLCMGQDCMGEKPL